jgi:hypothetical protein
MISPPTPSAAEFEHRSSLNSPTEPLELSRDDV